jgi:uncharacterized protein involved in response to NO
MAGPLAAPTLGSVRPLPPEAAPGLEPYRVLFPLGAACAILGTLPWVALAMGWSAWPGPLHATIMMEGFELAFVAGFLLTAMPAFTHGSKCRSWELWLAAAGVTAFAVLRFAGLAVAAHVAFAGTLAFVGGSVARRVRFGAAAPPEEFAMVGAGILLGVAGGATQALTEAGVWVEPAPRFGLHLVSRGMMLAIVLGLGGLLVPTFALVAEPLRILGVARAGERRPRRAFLAALAVLLAGAMAAEALGAAGVAAWMRAGAGAASLLLAWKLTRLPGKAARLPWALWVAGTCLLGGLLAAALWPAHEIAAWHVAFIGGYGLLTLAIGTRVVVSHGGHVAADEARLLGIPALACVALALALRLAGGEANPALSPMLGAAAGLWSLAWLLWLAAALPRIVRTKRALMMPGRQ